MIKITFLLLSLLSFIEAAQSQTGCLLSYGGKHIVDEKCKCLAENTCAKFQNFKFNDKLFGSQKDKNGNALFSAEQIAKLKEATDLFNQIIILKSKGEGKSDEIKALYVQLDKVNFTVRKLALTRHSQFLVDAKARYQSDLEAIKRKNKKIESRINEYIKNGAKPAAPTKREAVAEVKSDKNAEVKKILVVQSSTSVTADSKQKEETKVENEVILKNLKPDKLKRSEDDSLFDILSKTYKRMAYPVLLGD